MTSGSPHYDYNADSVLGGIFRHWIRMCGDRAMPRRADIRPQDIPSQLRYLQLIDVVDGTRFRYRLLGTKLIEVYGKDYTGTYTDEQFEGERLRLVSQIYSDVVMKKRPMFLRNKYRAPNGIEIIANRLYMPLSENGSDVSMILGGITFQSPFAVAGLWQTAKLDRMLHWKEEAVLPTPAARTPVQASISA